MLQEMSSAASSPAKGVDLKDDGDSGSPHTAQVAPLTTCPPSSMPPPQPRGPMNFGGPRLVLLDIDDKDEHMFV